MKNLFILFLASLLFWGGYCVVNKIQAKQNYIGYLKRAADANSIEMAKKELSKAITEIERQGLTSGYTSVLWKTPDEDLGFWYDNLKTSLKELSELPVESSGLEKSNMLMKLRETLLDHNKDGDSVTYPKGVFLYPSNTIIAIWGSLSLILTVIFFLIAGIKYDWFG